MTEACLYLVDVFDMVDEYEYLRPLGQQPTDVLFKPLQLVIDSVKQEDFLGDFFVGCLLCQRPSSDVDLHWVLVKDVFAELFNFFWKCCREKKCLAIRTNLANDRSELVLKSKVEHLISFIDHEKGAPGTQREGFLS